MKLKNLFLMLFAVSIATAQLFILSCSGLIYRVDPGRIEKYENKILQIFHRNLSNGLPSRPDGFRYAIDLAEIMQSAVEIGDSILFSKAYEAIKKHYIIRDTWIDSAIAWRYKNDSEIDTSGTAETIHCAFAIYLAYKKWGVEEYKKLSYSLAKAYIKHGYAPEPGKFLVKNYFNYGTRTLSENTYLINQRPDFLYLIGKENNDNDMIEKSKMMYNAIISGYVKNGFFHSLYDIGVKTIIPGSDGYYSPNGVFPLISSIDISLSIIEFNPKPAREILDFFHENFGRWSDFYTLNNDKFRAQTNYASAAVYSKIIEVYLKLGKSAKYKDMIKYIVGDLLPEKIDGIINLTERNLDSFYFELAITLRTLHKVRAYGV